MRLRITGQHVYRAGLTLMVVLTAGVLIGTHTVDADWGNPAQNYNYFNTSQYLGGGGYNAVIGTGLSTPGSIAAFQSQILGIYNSGTWAKYDASEGGWGGYKTGAAFIIQTMEGGTNHTMPNAAAIQSWEDDLSNPDLEMQIAYECNTSDGDHDSGYNQLGTPGSGNEGGVAWLIQPQCGNAIVFKSKSKGTIYYIIRLACGNPFGVTNALPHYVPPPPDHPPTGTITSVTCDASTEEYVIKATWGDSDGTTQGEITGSGGGVPPGQAGGNANPTAVGITSATWYIKTVDLYDNAWPIKLQVRDREPAGLGGALDGYKVVDTSSATKPNCAPVGTIADSGGSCTTVSFKLWDPNEPDSNIDYYLAVNGAAKQGKFTFGGQDASAATRDVSSYPGFDYWKKNNVVLYGVDVDTGTQYNLANVSLPVCGSIHCGTSSLPANLVAGQATPFDVTVTITGPPGTPGPSGAKFTAIQIGSQDTSSAYAPANPTVATTLTSVGQSYTAPGSGTFTGSWTFGGGESNPATLTCPLGRNVTAVYEPYFTVLGGDISAGQGFGGACTDDDTTADIEGYNSDTGGAAPNYFGASSRGAAIATGTISQFATDLTNNDSTNSATKLGGSTDGLTTATTNSPPSGLAFANSTANGTTYGGQYLHGEPNTFKWCVPDYQSQAAPASGTFNPASITSGTYTLSGNTIGNLNIPSGAQVTVEATGNVYINGDIKYNAYSGNPKNIPQFNLLVKGGNIYISGSGVQELHGFYAAEPNGTNTGIMYTCATGVSAPSTSYSTCNHSLTFYGAVAAHEIVPGRTFGNIAKTTSGTSDYPAEQFVFTPELWLSGASGATTSCAEDPTQVSCLYQSYTSLPPVL